MDLHSQSNNDLKSVMKDVSHDGHLVIPFVYRILVNTLLIYPDVVREASIALRSLQEKTKIFSNTERLSFHQDVERRRRGSLCILTAHSRTSCRLLRGDLVHMQCHPRRTKEAAATVIAAPDR
jgi:hypothetical protein